MARVRDMQGVPSHIVKLKSDGKRRHPSHCIFAEGKGKQRYCTNEQCPVWKENCRTAARCDFYEEKDIKMDELYRLLINFSYGVPITRKRLLRIQGITPNLIQKALDDGCIIETTSSDIGEIRYLITTKGQKRL